MKHEFKVTRSKDQTIYTLESATGGSTSAGSIASVDSALGGVQRRTSDSIFAQEAKKEEPKPRNFVAKNAKMGGAGKMKDKSKTIPRHEKHKKPVAEGVAETVPMQYAQKVLNHYGADYFKTTHDTLYFSKYRKQFSIDRIRDDDSASAGSVSLSDLNNIVRKLRDMRVPLSPFGEGVAEDHEIQMASSELQSIAKNAVHLLDLVRKYSEQEGLEAWQQSKITKSADYLNSVLQSISGKQSGMEETRNNYHANTTGFSRGQRDPEGENPQGSQQVWGLKINGKVWSKDGKDVTFTSKEAALNTRNAILKNRPKLEIGLVTKGGMPEDAYMESLTNMLERSVSQAQHNLMVGVAHNPQFAQKVKVKQKVGQEFAQADVGHDISKLPIRVPKKK